MSDPITTGIGLGVGTSLLTGSNPLVGGALGGLGGGVFGGFKPGGFASGMFGSTPAAGIVGTTGEMGSSLLQSVNPVTGALTNAGAIPLNSFDKISNAVNSVAAPYENWASENPFLAKTGGNLLQNQLFGSQAPQMQPNPLSQISVIPGQNSLAGRVTGLKTTAQPLPPRTVFGGYRG
jgi:hypothetical protein